MKESGLVSSTLDVAKHFHPVHSLVRKHCFLGFHGLIDRTCLMLCKSRSMLLARQGTCMSLCYDLLSAGLMRRRHGVMIQRQNGTEFAQWRVPIITPDAVITATFAYPPPIPQGKAIAIIGTNCIRLPASLLDHCVLSSQEPRCPSTRAMAPLHLSSTCDVIRSTFSSVHTSSPMS